MKPNENVYGSSANWQQQFFSQAVTVGSPPANKCPSFNNNNYSQLYYGLQNQRVRSGEPIDISISYCGLAQESASCHRYSLIKNQQNEIETILAEDSIANFFFWERTGNSMIFGSEGVIQQSKAWYGSISDGNINAQISPLCSINAKNQVLGVRVWALNAAKTSGTSFSLEAYKNNYENYPNVVSVYCRTYNGYQTPRDSGLIHGGHEYGNIMFGMGLLSPYKYSDGSDIYAYAIEQAIEQSTATIYSNMFVIEGSMHPARYSSISASYVPVIKTTDINDWHYEFTDTTYLNQVYIYKVITSSNIDAFYENCLKQVACFGLYFSPIESVCISGQLTDPNMYIGILEDGLGRGKYLKGSETINAPQNSLDTMSDIIYDPSNPPDYDNTDYQNNTQFFMQLPPNSFVKYWVLTESQVNELANELYQAIISAPAGQSIEAYSLKTFLTMNPIDAIISLQKFPCNPLHGLVASNVKLGTYETQISAYPLLCQTYVYDFTFNRGKQNSLFPVYGKTFLDYEPYTKCELTVPFCGTVEIPCTYIHDYDDLTVRLIIDFVTGVCTAVIMCHGVAIATTSGTCAITLPVTGVQSATLDQQIHSVAHRRDALDSTQAAGFIASAAAFALAFATGNVFAGVAATTALISSAASNMNQLEQINYDAQHMQVPMKQVTAASGAIAQTMDMRCRLRITRPKMSDRYDAERYAETIGFSCCANGRVRDFHGLTVAQINLDDVSATPTEKNIIQQAFAAGVYLP